jgi:uncharacterized protein YjbJ (UPF0337 family)
MRLTVLLCRIPHLAEVTTLEVTKNERPMNKLQMKGSWNVMKGKLKQHFGRFSQGKADEWWGRLQKTLGKWMKSGR